MWNPQDNFCYKHNKEKSGYNLVLWCNDCDAEAKNQPAASIVYPSLSLKKFFPGERLSYIGYLNYFSKQEAWDSSLPQGYRRYFGGLLIPDRGACALFRIENQEQVKLFESMSMDHREGDKAIKMTGYVNHDVFYEKGLEDDLEVALITFQP